MTNTNILELVGLEIVEGAPMHKTMHGSITGINIMDGFFGNENDEGT